MKFLSSLILTLCCLSSYSQTTENDSIKKRAVTSIYEDAIFTKAPVMPKLKNGVSELEDTLTKILFDKIGSKPKSTNIYYFFEITRTGQLKNISINGGQRDYPMEKQIESALVNTSYMWEPAKQHNRPVNAMKLILFTVDNKRVTITDFDK